MMRDGGEEFWPVGNWPPGFEAFALSQVASAFHPTFVYSLEDSKKRAPEQGF